MELACAHIAWFRRGLLWRIQVACLVAVDLACVLALFAPRFGRPLPDAAIAGMLGGPAAVWLAVVFLWVKLDEHARGSPGTLRVDAGGIAVARGSGAVRPLPAFAAGWLTRADPALELQTASGDLLYAQVAEVAEVDEARRWLAATGLDTRDLAMRLDDGMTLWAVSPVLFSMFACCGLGGLLLAVGMAQTLAFDLVAGAVGIAAQLATLRRVARATLVVTPAGIRVHRFARRVRAISWHAIESIEDDDDRDDEALCFELAGKTRLRLRCSLEAYRRRALVDRVRGELARFRA